MTSKETMREERSFLKELKLRYEPMKKADLEALAIAKILEHRRQMEADQSVYEEWTRASEDPTMSASVLRTLQDEYLARQEKADVLHKELSAILDILGYIPTVTESDGNPCLD